MRFKVDENLPVEVAALLRAAGHEADTVTEEGVGGSQDPDLATLIQREGRALITLDLGFADIREPATDRKELAKQLHAEVSALHARVRG